MQRNAANGTHFPAWQLEDPESISISLFTRKNYRRYQENKFENATAAVN